MKVMEIGIIPVQNQQTILVGPHQKAINLSTTHVRQVGVFPTVETMEFGQRLLVQVHLLPKSHYTTAPTKV